MDSTGPAAAPWLTWSVVHAHNARSEPLAKSTPTGQFERSLQQARATDDGNDAPGDGPNVVRIRPRT